VVGKLSSLSLGSACVTWMCPATSLYDTATLALSGRGGSCAAGTAVAGTLRTAAPAPLALIAETRTKYVCSGVSAEMRNCESLSPLALRRHTWCTQVPASASQQIGSLAARTARLAEAKLYTTSRSTRNALGALPPSRTGTVHDTPSSTSETTVSMGRTGAAGARAPNTTGPRPHTHCAT
jgi:hypothetical protein